MVVHPLGNDTGRLLVQDLNQRAAAAGEQGVKKQQRYGGDQAHHRGYQRLGNSAGHQFRVAGSKQADGLESQNHTCHRTQQSEQGGDRGQQFDQAEAALQGGRLTQDRFIQQQLGGINIPVMYIAGSQ